MHSKLTIQEAKVLLRERLKASTLTEYDARKLQLEVIPAQEVGRIMQDDSLSYCAVRIPYFKTETGKSNGFFRMRLLEDTRDGFQKLTKKRSLRYLQPPNTLAGIYTPPFIAWRELVQDPHHPLIITEGEFKAAAACKAGFPTIGLGGVSMWRNTKRNIELLPALASIEWNSRDVYIVFDSDAIHNPDVCTQETKLSSALTDKGAVVHIARLPPMEDNSKQGIDDFLLHHSIEEFNQLLNQAVPYLQDAPLHQMNTEVVYIKNPGFIYVLDNGARLNAARFTREAYANRKHTVSQYDSKGNVIGNKQISTAQTWLEWKARTELQRITFQPGERRFTEDGCLNTWKGYEIQPKRGDTAPWRYIMERVFGRNAGAQRYFEQWCAYPLQNPGAKMAVAILLWSVAHGVGKSAIGHALMRIYGKHSIELKDAQLEDDRNEWAENRQFCLADDITRTESRRYAAKLKTLITQKEMQINAKYIPQYTLPDCINWMFTSNDPGALPIEKEDRRYFVWEVQETAEELGKWVREIFVPWRDTEVGAAALFYHLLNVDLTGFDPNTAPPGTESKLEMVRYARSDIGNWLSDTFTDSIKSAKFFRFLGLPEDCDVVTARDCRTVYATASGHEVANIVMERELRKIGAYYLGQIEPGGSIVFAIRNVEKWKPRNTAQRAKMFAAVRPPPLLKRRNI